MAPRKRPAKTAAKNYDLAHFLLADDVRSERGGKLIIIGLYADVIRVKGADTYLPTLAMLFAIRRLTKRVPSEIVFSVTGPDDVEIVRETSFPVMIRDRDELNHNLIFRHALFVARPGAYTARLRLDGTEAFEGHFTVEVNPDAFREDSATASDVSA